MGSLRRQQIRHKRVTRGVTNTTATDEPHPGAALASEGTEAEAAHRVDQVSALFDAQWPGMVRLALLMVGDRPSAEDVAAEAFTELYRRWDTLRDKGSALRYLRSAILNRSRSLIRRRQVAYRHTPPHEPPIWSAENEVVLSEDRREVLRALTKLSRRRREVLVLRFYLELTDAEIAATLGVREGTVRSQAARGIAALGQILEGTR
jgi:RNA polymerase sigma-70 factor (sigma-E family)